MNKKLIISISAAVLAVVLIIVGVVIVKKNNEFNVENIDDLKPVKRGIVYFENQTAAQGDTVRIPIKIKRNPGIWGGQITVDFDDNALEFVSCSNGEVFDECEANGEETAVNLLVTQKNIKNSKENDVIAYLTFKVKDDALVKKHEITINERTNFCNIKGALVEPEYKVGIIKVE